MTRSILVVEDEQDMATLLAKRLAEIALRVDVAHDGISGHRMAEAHPYDLIILDLTLPGMDGIDVCARIRGRSDYVPIIAVTARGTEQDKISGLDAGADDYVTKPFSIEELLSRARALLRRTEEWRATAASDPVVKTGILTIDVARRGVTIGGTAIALTAKEFDLLLVLARSPGTVIARADLLRDVWGYSHAGYRHTVDTHVSRLRAKLERCGAQSLIETAWGVGYRLRIPEGA